MRLIEWLWGALAAVAAVVAGLLLAKRKGRQEGAQALEAKAEAAKAEREARREEIDRDVAAGGDARERLRNDWTRDDA